MLTEQTAHCEEFVVLEYLNILADPLYCLALELADTDDSSDEHVLDLLEVDTTNVNWNQS